MTPQKREALRQRLALLGIDPRQIVERAIRASGPGGQKVNKTSSGVLLRYPLPSVGNAVAAGEAEQILVKWTRERHHALNRFLALRELADAVEHRRSPATSLRQQAIDKLRKQKARARRRRNPPATAPVPDATSAASQAGPPSVGPKR